MKRNVLALGERSLSGDFGRIWSAGDINITDSTVKSIYSAGDVDIINSTVRKLRCAGDIDASASSFKNFKAAGDVNLKGVCKADTVVVMGELTVDFFECRVLRNFSRKAKVNSSSSIIEWHGSFKAETFESLFIFKLNCDYDFKNIISSAKIICQNEIKCDNFYSFSGIAAELINADNIFILTADDIKLQSIVGSNITISNTFKPDKRFKAIPKSASYEHYRTNGNIISVTAIEGDNINIENTKADFVSGMDVIIGDLCVIEKVEYKNSIHISDKAVVSEVKKFI